MTDLEIRRNIESSINNFGTGNLTENSISFFKTLGYATDRQAPLEKKSFQGLKELYLTEDSKFNEEKALCKDWNYVDLLFQISKEEVLKQISLFDSKKVDKTIIESYLFFTIELEKEHYNRTILSNVTREVNKIFRMPVMILFKHGKLLTLSIINRRLNKKDADKDVLEKVILIKDIKIENPHRAHLDIIFELTFDELNNKYQFTNFVELHNAWLKTLDIKQLNKRFYEDLFKWYAWTVKCVKFPQLRPQDDLISDEAHQSESVIRLLTRILFCWFMKEKQELIPKILFDEDKMQSILKNFKSNENNNSTYYRAILQNLFFATLSVPIEDRKYISKSFQGKNSSFGDQYVFRYQDEFYNAEEILKIFKDIPFLNGGLFDSLDKKEENENSEIRLDGFSSNPKKQAFVPNFIFWGTHSGINLSTELNNPRKKNETVQGLFTILNAYKFTIEENTPLEEEIALDPDLLGRTFENLLASYNPETKVNARKQTGSFYTPREIVEYMVDECLISSLKNIVSTESDVIKFENKIRRLVSYSSGEISFTDIEKEKLINAIDKIKILDPACGSGAFPLGILQKLVLILNKIDPENKRWFESLIKRLPEYTQSEMRKKLEQEDWNYVRKLGLIQQCIYGIDIQPIAIQITKLRFFISLIVDQRIKNTPQNNFGLLPLPNLDFKMVCANTLVAVPNENVSGGIEFKDEFTEKFTSATAKYFSASKPLVKKAIENEIKILVDSKVKEKLKAIENIYRSTSTKVTAILKNKRKEIIKQKERDASLWKSYNNLFKHESVGFFDTKYFFPEVKNGFDVVLGNPPFGAKFTQDEKDYFKEKFVHQNYQPESFLFFIEKSFEFLKDSGLLSFIIPNTWLTNLKLIKIRQFLTGFNTIQNISHYTKSVFDAIVDTEVVIFRKGYIPNNEVIVFNHLDANQVLEFKHDQDNWKNKNGDVINIFSTGAIEKIIAQLKTGTENLSAFANVFAGVVPYEEGKGKPPQTRKMMNDKVYNSEKRIDSSYRKVLRGSDINKYENNWDGRRWLKYGENLAAPRKAIIFDSPKIVVRQTGDSLIATYDIEKFITLKNTHVINAKTDVNLKFLLALMNSKVLNFHLQYMNPEVGEALAEVKKENVEKLLIKKTENQRPFIILVDYILLLKKQRISSVFFERLIDAMVYELYFPEKIQEAGCQVLKYLTNISEFKEKDDKKNLELMEEAYKELSDPGHPVSAALLKLLNVEEVNIIEGRK